MKPEKSETIQRARTRWSVMLGTVLCLSAFPACGAWGQAVSGTVTEQSSGRPVAEAAVILLDLADRPRAAVTTDSTGGYRILAPSSGAYRLSVQRIGLVPFRTAELNLKVGVDMPVDAVMTLSVAALPTVSVVADHIVDRPPGNTHKYDEFLRRRKLGMGTFLTRADIESHARGRMQEVFNGIPGIKVREDGTRWFLQSQRCSGRGIPGLDAGALGGSSSSGRGRDPKLDPALFVDGFRVRDISALSDLAPQQIEAIEIYQGAAQLPAEARGDACFAIFVWLKAG